MENQLDPRKVIAGLFFVAGLVMIGVSIFFIGLERGLTQPKFHIIALFNQVGGLVEGAPIRVSGVNVGVVGSIDFMDQPVEGRSLKVSMNIFKKYEAQFRKCSRLSIRTEGVLGQKLVDIYEDKNRPPFDLSQPIIGEDPLDVEGMAEVVRRTALSLQHTSDRIDDVMNEWKYISHKTRRLFNRVEEKLNDGNLFKIF